ncbi:MAG: hypothetical protein CR982_07700 [Candidatus Cloacimonadota bacterium]|nr:MAG: hypothetical protein CR982_07700 [Candidatus Cloacimonadota bacterium]PIE78261.1 MAG: hypothetical protein CSA15_08840 [Candidatus Delongbacteria bacterium]
MDEKLARRLEIIKSAEKIGISKTAELFNINRKTVSKWLKRYQEGGDSSLVNRSKKHQNQPDKMPLSIEESILSLKRSNTNLSANKIKNILNINYSVTAINKKIREAGLNKKSEVVKNIYEGVPLTEFYIFIKKNSLGNQEELHLPNYQIIVEGKATGIEFVGYSYERSGIAIAIFVDYIITKLIKCGLNKDFLKFYFNDSSAYSKKKTPIEMVIKDKFNLSYTKIDKDKLKRIRSLSFSMKKSSFTELKIENEKQLLIETYAYLLHYNYKRDMESSDNFRGFIPKKLIKKLLLNIPPIIVDNYITKFKDILNIEDFWEKSFSLELLEPAVEYLSRVGEFAAKDNENRKAIDFYNQVLILLKTINKPYLITNIYHKLGYIYQKIGDKRGALKSFSEGLKIAKESDNKKYIMLLNANLAVQHYMMANYKTSIEFAKKTIKLAEAIKDTQEIINSNQVLGVVNEALGRYQQSLKFYKNVIHYAKEKEYTLSKVKALGNIGVIYFKKMQLKKALYYHKEAYNLCKTITNNSQMVRLLNNIGCIYDEMGEFDNAMFNYKQLLSFSTKSENLNGIITAISNIGNVYLSKGDFSKALINFNMMLEKSKQAGNRQLTSVAYANIADIYKNIVKYKLALEYYDYAIKISKNIDDKYYLCSFIYEKAELLFLQKDLDSAQKLGKKAYKLACDVERGDIIFDSWLFVKKLDFIRSKRFKSVLKIQDDIIKLLIAKIYSEEKKENKIALYYTIYNLLINDAEEEIRLTYNLSDLKRNAIRGYKSLYEKVPKYLYKIRLEELKNC